ALRAFGRVFRRCNARGERVYSRDECRAFLMWSLLRAPDFEEALASLGADGLLLVGEYAARIGLSAQASLEENAAAIEDYFRSHPIRLDLAREIEECARTLRTSNASAAWSKFLGT